MENRFKTDSSQVEDEYQEDAVQLFRDFSNPDILVQVSQLINWVNTYTVNQSKDELNTDTFMDGFCLIQGLQAHFERSQKSNVNRDHQILSVNEEKSELEQENAKLKQQLKEQSGLVEKFKKRNAKLENHEKKIAVREVMPLGKLKCKVANLQLVFDTLVSKLKKEPLNQKDTFSVQRKQELGEFRREVGDLFGRVKHNMKKWEKNRKEMVGKLEKTRVGLNSLNETVMLPPLQFTVEQSSTSSRVYPLALLPDSTPSISTSTAVQSTGKLYFDVSNELSTSSACNPKSKQLKSGISVKTALSKHIKSRNTRRVNETSLQNIYQTEQLEATTPTFMQGARKSHLEPVAPNPRAARDGHGQELFGDSTNIAVELPQKLKSPIVCGLCGTGFSTLVQLKLHHAVLHTESTGSAVRYLPHGDPIKSNKPSHHENIPQLNEAVRLAQYFSTRLANNVASTSAAANLEHYLMQYLFELAAGICIPSLQNSDSFPGHENDTS